MSNLDNEGRFVMQVFLLAAGAMVAIAAAAQPDRITIDYPAEDTIFPPEITAPTFLWRDPVEEASTWVIEATFGGNSSKLTATSRGERLRVGEIDPRAIGVSNELPTLTPLEAVARSWKPDSEMWESIQRRSVDRPATITITGYRDGRPGELVSRGQVAIQTSKDPVGAPIFYRDVPLMPSELEKGVIKPLARAAIPLIAWRLRYIGEPQSRLLMEGLHTCTNCHSFSRDGRTLGMEVDGPQNDKGTYAIAPITPRMSIRNEDVISWNSFPGSAHGQKTTAFMAQLSPDGQHVVATVNEQVYVANFKDYRFLQVFYPTRGILGWYSRATGQFRALPGADDSSYVHTTAFWSPDGKYLVFARAEAREAYPRGRMLAQYSNDPNEIPVQYDLYRIPFRDGNGGRAEPIAGASGNGMSNSFPKISPDGRWIVFVQSRNGQLMRPDGQLYIVPAEGGKARRMRCNTPLMNSWHSFSPNGRWMVFSSKARSPYTQMYLTHLDEEGNDSPPVLIENATAANRAVNLPEFANIPQERLLSINVPASEFYRLYDTAWELAEKGQHEAAIVELRKALAISPGDAKALNNLGIALARTGKLQEAAAQWRKALEAKSDFTEANNNLGIALLQMGRAEEAKACFRRALETAADSFEAYYNLGGALLAEGNLDEAVAHLERAVALRQDSAEAHYALGRAFAGGGVVNRAIIHYERAVELRPAYAEAHNSLGVILAQNGRMEQAIGHWRKALEANPGHVEARQNLQRSHAGQ